MNHACNLHHGIPLCMFAAYCWLCLLSCKLTPAFEDVLQLCGSLPCVVAAAAASLELLPVTAPKACGSYITGRASEGGGRPYCGADRLGQSSSRTRLPSGRARNVRLETVMNACRSVEVQVCFHRSQLPLCVRFSN